MGEKLKFLQLLLVLSKLAFLSAKGPTNWKENDENLDYNYYVNDEDYESQKNLETKNSKKSLFYESTNVISPCSCGMEYKLLDLGYTYFPRYIHSMICKEAICGNLYRCNARYYKVRVLKKKNQFNKSKKGAGLREIPRDLKNSWTSEVIDVIVACECIP